jgi:uncharacterized membrane protein
MWTHMSYMVKFKFFIVLIEIMFFIVGKKKSRLSPSRKKSATI